MCFPQDLAFADSNSGFVIVANLPYDGTFKEFNTRDGGLNFSTLRHISPPGVLFYECAFAPSPSFFLFADNQDGIDISMDSGNTWRFFNSHDYPDTIRGPHSAFFAEVTWPEAQLGMDTMIRIDAIENPGRLTYRFAISTDRDSTFGPLGDTIAGTVSSGGYAAKDLSALFAILSSQKRGWAYILARSVDTGAHWQYVIPVDTTNTKTVYTKIFQGYGAGHYFLSGGKVDSVNGSLVRLDDYVESHDTGRTWSEVTNISGGRVFCFANPDSNILWCAIGRAQFDAVGFAPTFSRNFADSLFYSDDGGKTWLKDGDTFKGDTICAMRWVTRNNGFVITYRDSSTYLYHYSEADSVTAGVTSKPATLPVPLVIYPSIAQDQLFFESDRQVRLFDVLGRTFHCQQSGRILHISGLPAGVYYVTDGTQRAKFVKE